MPKKCFIADQPTLFSRSFCFLSVLFCSSVFVTSVIAGPTVAPVNFLLLKQDEPFITPAKIYDSGDNPKYLSAGHLNGDSFIDFAVPSHPDDYPGRPDPQVFIHMNNGSGGFTASTINTPGGDSEHTLIADLKGDNDNYDDILVSHRDVTTDGFSVILNNADGTFSDPIPYLTGLDGRGGMIAGDFDGDGDTDIAIAIWTAGGGYLQIMTNDGSGSFSVGNTYTLGQITGLDIADIDGVNGPDLLLTVFGDPGSVVVLRNNAGSTSPFLTAQTPYTVHAFPYDGKFVDANGDGDLDILVGGAGVGADDPGTTPALSTINVTFLPGDGTGSFDDTSIVQSATQSYKSRGFTVADFNGDDMVDIVATSQGSEQIPPGRVGQDVRVIFGDDSGSFDFDANASLVYDNFWYARGVVAEDIDNDFDTDIIFAYGGNNTGLYDGDNIGVLQNNMPQ